jgi:RimJ/RimL family protein N-acetyltransferase
VCDRAQRPAPADRTVGIVLVRLESGARVRIRPIRPDDGALLADGLEHLSDESAYQRFLSPKQTLSAGERRYLTEVDFRDHVALVAVRPEAPGELVGVGRWIRLPDEPDTAEIAFVVSDALQRQGLGIALAEALADSARDRGVRRFVATMLPDNVAAHRLFAHVAPGGELRVAGTLHEVRGEISGGRARRAGRPLRSAPAPA